MNGEEIVVDRMEPHAREFCEMIKLRDEFGSSLRPSSLIPNGSACSPGETFDLSDAAMQNRDRELAPQLLDQLKGLRSSYPQLAAEYGLHLVRAEEVWTSCIAS
ncbi:MAG TPA: hypothetical protein VHX60_03545 [Acidobacteriaceae bacterium]|jgi:hypothetical protein|nr:hypothetical protein [Acidobacteriaceae bacterium]